MVRRAVARAARAGARWLEELAGAPVSAATWDRLERRLDRPPADPAPAEFPDAGVARRPAAGRGSRRARRPAASLAWRTVPTTRARFAVLATDEEADIDLVLVGLDRGRRFPRHVHLGNEEVVILAGAYTDDYAHLGPGNYYHYPPGSEHGTLTDPGEPCWTLGLLEHGIMFRGVLGALQWMIDPPHAQAMAALPAGDGGSRAAPSSAPTTQQYAPSAARARPCCPRDP